MLVRRPVTFVVTLLGAPFVNVAQTQPSALTFAVAASAQEGDPRVRLTLDSEIRGTVRIRGCVPDPSDLTVEAATIDVGPLRRDTAPLDPRAAQRTAWMSSTTDRHVFSFVIRGLQPLTLYQLSVSTPPSPVCGKLFWRNQTRGLAVSGGDPVLIEGVAATTSIEVQHPGTDEWVGGDLLDFTNPAVATRRMRWRSTLPDVIGGELQISTAVFPHLGDFDACDEPEGGVVYRQAVPAVPGEWADVGPIDFNTIVERRLAGGDGVSVTGRTARTTLRMLLIGAPIYARVVPMTPTGAACNTTEQGVPGWVLFVKVPTESADPPAQPPTEPVLEAGTAHVYRPPDFYRPSQYQPDVIHPTYDEYGYRVVRLHFLPTSYNCLPYVSHQLELKGLPNPWRYDPIGCWLVQAEPWRSGTILFTGDRFVIRKSWSSGGGSSLLDTFVNFVTAGGHVLEIVVDYAAAVYNGAVDAVKDIGVDAARATLGPICDGHEAECDKGVRLGMTYGMASMGLPPSVPSWHQLKQEGLDYLAGQVGDWVEEETGVPSQLTTAVLRKVAQQAIDDMTQHIGGDSPTTNWHVRDIGLTPASWRITVGKRGLDPLPIDVALFTQKTPLYGSTFAPLPHQFPPPLLPGVITVTGLRVPIVMPPNLDGIRPPVCRSGSPVYTAPDPPQYCFPNIFAPFGSAPVCQAKRSYKGAWEPWPCDSYGDLIAIYYRDAWAGKVLGTTCTPLAAVTLAKAPVVEWPYIVWPKFTFNIFAAVPPMVGGTWDGGFINACQ
jgi:hypothetical protein